MKGSQQQRLHILKSAHVETQMTKRTILIIIILNEGTNDGEDDFVLMKLKTEILRVLNDFVSLFTDLKMKRQLC